MRCQVGSLMLNHSRPHATSDSFQIINPAVCLTLHLSVCHWIEVGSTVINVTSVLPLELNNLLFLNHVYKKQLLLTDSLFLLAYQSQPILFQKSIVFQHFQTGSIMHNIIINAYGLHIIHKKTLRYNLQ